MNHLKVIESAAIITEERIGKIRNSKQGVRMRRSMPIAALALFTTLALAKTEFSLSAEADTPPMALPENAGADAPVVAPEGLVTVPALTPVIVRLDEEVSSKMHKPGDHFRIAIAEDVRIGDAVVIPAGSAGEGEVIHAAKPGAGGKGGELILAARYVRAGDTEVRLRSFTLGVAGRDHSDGALASSFIIGPLAMFVRGGAVIVARNALGSAKTAVELKLPAMAASGAPSE